MHQIQRARRLLWGFVVLCLMVGGSATAQQPKTTKIDGTVTIAIGTQERLQMKTKQPIRSDFVSNKDVLRTEEDRLHPSYIILTGLQEGSVRIELTDANGVKETYEVVVLNDVNLLKSILRRAAPTANVDVVPFRNGVILTGNVARAEDVDTILRVAGAYIGGAQGAQGSSNIINALTVGGVHQVQLDVTVARVDRTKGRQREFTLIVGGTTVSAGSVLGGLTTAAAATGNSTVGSGVGITSGVASALPTASANLVLGIVPPNIQMLLQALKTEGLAKLVAEPRLVTQSGRPARFLSGGRQATIGPSSGITGPGVVYEEVGTELEFLPIVYGNGKIYLEVAPRVRGVNQGLGLAASGTLPPVPGFDEQSIRTSIVLESGQTFAIGGLIQTSVQSSTKKVPWLGELPFIGSAFSAVSYTETEQELVILVTPHLVDPMDCNQVPQRLPGKESRAPDDFELYLESMMELPRGQRNVFEGRRYKAAWKNDPTAGEFPCGPTKGGYGVGLGNCSTSGCAPATKSAAAPISQTREPASLPMTVNTPLDIPVAPRDR